ncbi:MAG TPA: hypothetical protein VLM83_11685 [Anaerolineales bacterium]|nr:hypothetical protein [Anaerolineales bacterium]
MTPTPPAVADFKKSYPIEFSLRNADDQDILYIDDVGDTFHLQISNTSDTTITIPSPARSLTSTSSRTHGPGVRPTYPFELSFRPGTLVDDGKKIVLNEKTWNMIPAKDAGGVVSLSFSIGSGKPVNLGPGQSLTLTLENVMASASGGARGTRVELHYRQLTLGSSKLEGVRVQHMGILNRHGRQHIPLNVGFVETNQVVNDGKTANSLLLRITNTLKRDPAYPERSTLTLRAGGDAPSKLVFSFVAGSPEMEWALGTPDQIGKIIVGTKDKPGMDLSMPSRLGITEPEINAGAIEKGFVRPKKHMPDRLVSSGTDMASELFSSRLALNPSPPNQSVVGNEVYYAQRQANWITKVEQEGEMPEWVLTPAGTSIQLEAEEYIQFYFSNLVTAHPSGLTNLYVYYKNIPGYWDGQFVCTIEKTRGAVPRGAIIMWYGSEGEIPDGWALCNGSKGTPNLKDRFIAGKPGQDQVCYLMKV